MILLLFALLVEAELCLDFPAVCKPRAPALPPIYYANLPGSNKRRVSFALFNLKCTRVPGADLRRATHRVTAFEKRNKRLFFHSLQANLTEYGISLEVDAVAELSQARGDFGITISHLLNLRQALRDGCEMAITMEDDAAFEFLPWWDRNSLPWHLGSLTWQPWEVIQLAHFPHLLLQNHIYSGIHHRSEHLVVECRGNPGAPQRNDSLVGRFLAWWCDSSTK
eukprot:TRINITY_DN5047_c0_g1_i4.p1 TRINITY_DN5047_c0_g1~~TRINITY_DN5047_c0_g1_i4.p1  ORF type:complete len:233 (-),score=21.45 TRINITY_DN5047_c0_g1_i4:379-1047(-)